MSELPPWSQSLLDRYLDVEHNQATPAQTYISTEDVQPPVYSKELLKGSTDTLLLSLLSRERMYGYRLAKEMEGQSGGYLRFKEGTLYPALHRLERDGLVKGVWEVSSSRQRRRYYYITEEGRSKLKSMLEEWRDFSRAVNLVALPDSA